MQFLQEICDITVADLAGLLRVIKGVMFALFADVLD
jgi:hypothetical protein